MAEIIFTDAICAECEKTLPKFTIAVVVQPDFIVCCECNEFIEENWRLDQESMLANSEEWGKCGGSV